MIITVTCLGVQKISQRHVGEGPLGGECGGGLQSFVPSNVRLHLVDVVRAVQYSAVQYSAVQYSTEQYNKTIIQRR